MFAMAAGDVERLCALFDHPIALKSMPGRGSRFSVAVPVAPAAVLPKSEPSHQAVIDVSARKLVVVRTRTPAFAKEWAVG
jgi:hypothetical protein